MRDCRTVGLVGISSTGCGDGDWSITYTCNVRVLTKCEN